MDKGELRKVCILHAATRQNTAQVLRDAATAYRVDTDAIALKVKQEFAAKQKMSAVSRKLRRRANQSSEGEGCIASAYLLRESTSGRLPFRTPVLPAPDVAPTAQERLCPPTHYKRTPFAASWSVALARVPSAAVAVKDLRPLRGAHRTRVLDRHPRCGCWTIMRSISASQFSNENRRAKKERSYG